MLCQVPINQSCYHTVDSQLPALPRALLLEILQSAGLSYPCQFKHVNSIYHLRSFVTFPPRLLNSSYFSLKTNNILFCNIPSYLNEQIIPVRITPWENGLRCLQRVLVTHLKWSRVPSGVCNTFRASESTNPFLLLARRLQFLPSPRPVTHTAYSLVHNPLVLSFIPTYLVTQTVKILMPQPLPWQLLYPAVLLKQFTASDGKWSRANNCTLLEVLTVDQGGKKPDYSHLRGSSSTRIWRGTLTSLRSNILCHAERRIY